MTATNHALTGTAIGLFIANPILALPLALISHFICDAIPHFGTSDRSDKTLRGTLFRRYLIVEAAICFVIVLSLATFRPPHWQLAAICAFLAASPDLLWIKRYIDSLNRRTYLPNWFAKFASQIQWFQKPIGAIVEITWLVAALILIAPVIVSN